MNKEVSMIFLQICMCVLIIAFPINVERKNLQNGIPNCPHIIPATPNKGFGTEATTRKVTEFKLGMGK